MPALSEHSTEPTCTHCGSSDVLFDAYATYNFATEEFEVFNIFDKGQFCQCCEGPCSVVWRPREASKQERTS